MYFGGSFDSFKPFFENSISQKLCNSETIFFKVLSTEAKEQNVSENTDLSWKELRNMSSLESV